MHDIETNRGQSTASNNELLNKLPTPLTMLLGSTYCLIVLGVILVIPILELAIGGAYRSQCPINSNIPVYLIVAGVCGITTILLSLVVVGSFICCIQRTSAVGTFAVGCLVMLILIFISCMSFFLFIWFIIGNVWIFGAKQNVQYDNPTLNTYCQRTLYQFAFAILIITYIMICLSCCVRCARGISGIMKSSE